MPEAIAPYSLSRTDRCWIYAPSVLFTVSFIAGILIGVRVALQASDALPVSCALELLEESRHTVRLTLCDFFVVPVSLLLASSTVGFCILPICFFARGFRLSSGIIALQLAGASSGVTALALAFPAFFSVLGAFLLCEEAFYSSVLLRGISSARILNRFRSLSFARACICAVLTAISSILREVLVSVLL